MLLGYQDIYYFVKNKNIIKNLSECLKYYSVTFIKIISKAIYCNSALALGEYDILSMYIWGKYSDKQYMLIHGHNDKLLTHLWHVFCLRKSILRDIWKKLYSVCRLRIFWGLSSKIESIEGFGI